MKTHLDHRAATPGDLPLLAEFNRQLIQDEGHRNPMTPDELRDRMNGLVFEGEFDCAIFSHSARADPVAYALYSESGEEIHLRQFFVARDRRREGIGTSAMNLLFSEIWPPEKRLRVDVLCHNQAAIAFWRSCRFEDYCLTLERPGSPSP